MNEVRIIAVHSPDELEAARRLASEFGAWAKGVARRDYGIDVDAAGEGLSTSIEELLPPHGRVYLARLDDAAVAVGGVKWLARDVAEIKRVYVQPHARGRGVGRVLVRRLLDDAREMAVRVVRLETAAFMRGAHALYRTFGFVDAPAYTGREFEDVPGLDAITTCMTLTLDPV